MLSRIFRKCVVPGYRQIIYQNDGQRHVVSLEKYGRSKVSRGNTLLRVQTFFISLDYQKIDYFWFTPEFRGLIKKNTPSIKLQSFQEEHGKIWMSREKIIGFQ